MFVDSSGCFNTKPAENMYGSFWGSVLGQSVSGWHQEAKGGGTWEGGIRLAHSHVISSIFNFILISWINDNTATLMLLIKAVDFMQLYMASSVNPTRETSPQS